MAYMDEQGGKDKKSTTDSLNMYDGQDGASGHKTEKDVVKEDTEHTTSGKQSRKSRPGLLERARRLLFGESTVGDRAKRGLFNWRMSGTAGGGGFMDVISKLATPKALTALVMGTSLSVFSILGIFTSYKNDDIIRNDNPIQCEPGSIELPAPGGSGDDVDAQEIVNILYDIFVNEFGYSKEALTGIVACMLVETGCNPDRLESDYLPAMKGAKEAFDSVAGPGTTPTSDVAQQAYWTYGELFKTQGGWNGNAFYMSDGGRMCPGIGLIQWTAGRANNFIRGLDKISMNVSPMDTHYQAAYLIAEANTSYPDCAPGSAFASVTNVDDAVRIFFGTMVYGNPDVQPGNEHLDKRLARLNSSAEGPGAIDLVNTAESQANSQFTMDAVTMAEELAEDTFSSSVSAAQSVQLCVNDTFIITSDIANAAVSISFLERGDYEDVQGAYGGYRRAARSPNIINDWNYIEGINNDPNTLGEPYNGNETYESARGVTSDPKKGWRFYDIDGAPGKLDLIACTEYYYFAHMIAFPKETGTSGQAGYFSSCDRGTATAVRIAGADDKFPAGNPLYQLMWAAGGEKQGAKHNENARGTQGAGFLWRFSGFMRGSDWYSASGSPSISPGTVMISWSVRAANGLLGENNGGATTGDGGMLSPEDTDSENNSDPDGSYGSKPASIRLAGLRWPMSMANTTRHIITYVGDATVQKFWGLDWLDQQWQLFDDADRLIRKDLSETVPEVMQKGLSLKANYAAKTSDQHMTFYFAKMRTAKKDGGLDKFTKEFGPANDRKVEFNEKTGLPEFKAWEQIYARLIHNSDDDAAAGIGTGDQVYEKAVAFGEGNSGDHGPGDGYLDGGEHDEIDSKIEQYDNEDTYHNKYFFEDWNSLGIAKSTDSVKSDHANDYRDPADAGGGVDKLIWFDKTDGNDDTPWTHQRGAVRSSYWRYELVTDIEYRQNQFLRFGLASLMCSYPSEEDADTFQSGIEGNDTGHIIGNIYRRYSRIPDKVDSSGRYYYYNTVVSNDMLQDLVQLYTEEKNAYTDGSQYVDDSTAELHGKNERNYGPMYLIGLNRVYTAARYNTTSDSGFWKDRRYGLTADDIAYIANGIEGNKMGEVDSDGAEEAFQRILTEPMHLLSSAQLALYDNTVNAKTSTDGRGAHESQHRYNHEEKKPYETEIYGMNPFLMLEGDSLLDVNMSEGEDNWEAGTKIGKSVRNDIEADLTGASGGSGIAAKGIDPTDASGKSDDRLAWIDRHYFVTDNGGIGTFAYQVLALQPSTGTKMTSAGYESELKSVKTLKAGTATGASDADNLFGSKGLVQYSDFIYGDDAADNQQMAKRLFGKDDRNKDGSTSTDGARDDYNRREFILIPYYHTHSQQCDHKDLIGYEHYELLCRWQNNTNNPSVADNLTLGTIAKIDTQVALNGQDGTNYQRDRVTGSCSHLYDDAHDYGETISFNTAHVVNRGKYDLDQILATIDSQDIRYFADTGYEIGWNDKPIIHVECDGWFQAGKCYGGCPDECYVAGHSCPNCETWICHACGEEKECTEYCYHPCSECLAMNYCHDHKECDDYGSMAHGDVQKPCHGCNEGDYPDHHGDGGHVDFSGQSDKCHYEFGCNALEYLYHNTDGADGPRKHYVGDYGHSYNGQVDNKPSFTTSGTLYDVHNLYMAIPVAPDVDMDDFDIRDYIKDSVWDPVSGTYTSSGSLGQNDVVVPDKCNLVQQVTYDANGWVDNNWQTMVDGSIKSSLLNPEMAGEYTAAVQSMIASQETHTSAIKAGHPSEDEGMNKGLLQYFTIEGDSIHRESDWGGYVAAVAAEYGAAQSEYIRHAKFNGTPDDLRALESIRNRVGYGKGVEEQTIDVQGSKYSIRQTNGPGTNGSLSGPVAYENSWHNEADDAASVDTGNGTGLGNHGWGEVAVTGTQHPKGPSESSAGSKGYGNCSPGLGPTFDGDPSVSGPDGSKGNNVNAFGPSLLREIIGDEHVVHVKFDTQDYEGLTAQDAGDNGRDFMFYVDKKMAAYELGIPEKDLEPKDYQNSESSYYQDHLDDFKDKTSTDAGANLYGVFKKMDMDTLYRNYYTGELTDKMYAENVYPHNATDKRRSDGMSEDNKENPLALAGESEEDGAVNGGDARQTITSLKERGMIPNADGNNKPNTGDYRNWVTHASRGHRGMMTQYLNFASFFKDAYKKGDAGEQDMNNAYMLFEVVMRSDIKTSEDGGTDEYGYPMGSNDADADKDWSMDGMPVTKNEGFVYTSKPSDAVLEIDDLHRAWGYGENAGFSDTYGQGSNSHWKNMIDLYNAAMSTTRTGY